MHCPNCGIQTPQTANYCTGCGEPLQEGLSKPDPAAVKTPEPTVGQIERELRYVLPMATPPVPLFAGYLGLFAPTLIAAPFAVIFGAIGLFQLRNRPNAYGHGRCWTGIIMGLIFSVLGIALIVSAV